ncbi:hypothetical protein JCM11641_004024 [Rhodosporidiobolus odoratus]
MSEWVRRYLIVGQAGLANSSGQHSISDPGRQKGDIERSEAMGRDRTVYEGELQGAQTGILSLLPLLSSSNVHLPSLYIFADNQSALRNLVDPSPTPGQQIRLQLRSLLLGLCRTHPETTITLQWCPGHVGIAGNERADELANEAVDRELAEEREGGQRRKERKRVKGGKMVRVYRKGMKEEGSSEGEDSDWDGAQETSTQLAKRTPANPHHTPRLPLSLSALRQQHEAALQAEWTTRWTQANNVGAALRLVDPRPPGKAFSRPFHHLPRRHAVLLSRLRLDFNDLGATKRFLDDDDPERLCKHCGKLETREHYLLECEQYEEERKELMRELKVQRIPGLAFLFSPAHIFPLLRFIHSTDRFPSLFSLVIDTPSTR